MIFGLKLETIIIIIIERIYFSKMNRMMEENKDSIKDNQWSILTIIVDYYCLFLPFDTDI